MMKCACCGKETLHPVRVGVNSEICMCCDLCAAAIMGELRERKKKKDSPDARYSMLRTEDAYVDAYGCSVGSDAVKFTIDDLSGITHTFTIQESHQPEMTSYFSVEVFKAGKNGKKLKSQPNTRFEFEVFGPTENEEELLSDLVGKTSKGVRYECLERTGFWGCTDQLVRGNKLYTSKTTGEMKVQEDTETKKKTTWRIDGEGFSNEEMVKLFSPYGGFRIQYQVVDPTAPVLEEDMMLMPVKLNDAVLVKELVELINLFSEKHEGTFISEREIFGFDWCFEKLLGKLSFYFNNNPRGKGKLAGLKMIKLLGDVESDDDMFPEYQIKLIQETVSERECFNHPEWESIKEQDPTEKELSKMKIELDEEAWTKARYYLSHRKDKSVDAGSRWALYISFSTSVANSFPSILAALGQLYGSYGIWLDFHKPRYDAILAMKGYFTSHTMEECYEKIFGDEPDEPEETLSR